MQLNLQSERLFIRTLTIIDAGFMLQLMNSPNWIKILGIDELQIKRKPVIIF